jgi:hypothetical protein
MLLSEARTRVAALCDDDGTRFSESEIDDALLTAQKETWQQAVKSGASFLTIETTAISTNSSGVADLTGIKPIKIVNVAEMRSGQRYAMNPTRLDQAPQNASVVVPLAIAYVPRLSFPSAAGNPFVWGHANVTDTSLFDKLMCALAASELKIKDDEQNKALEKRKDELRAAVNEMLSIPGWSVMPMDSFSSDRALSSYAWVLTAPDTLQLVWI